MLHRLPNMPRSRRLAGIGLLALSVPAWTILRAPSQITSSPPPIQSAPSANRLIVTPDPLAFGVLEPGHAARGTITLHNPNHSPVTVARVETSCPCVRVASSPITVAPRGSSTMTVAYVPTEEPDFHGGLAVEVVGRDSGEAVLFRTKATFEIYALQSGRAQPSHICVSTLTIPPDFIHRNQKRH